MSYVTKLLMMSLRTKLLNLSAFNAIGLILPVLSEKWQGQAVTMGEECIGFEKKG